MKKTSLYFTYCLMAIGAAPAYSSKGGIAFKEPGIVDTGYVISILAITVLLLFVAAIVLAFIKKRGLIKTLQSSNNGKPISVISSTRISTRTTAILVEIEGSRLVVLEHPSSITVKEISHNNDFHKQK